jgi:hypothetical protein
VATAQSTPNLTRVHDKTKAPASAGAFLFTGIAAHPQSEECVPSHKGALLLCLQAQKNTLPVFVAVYFTGEYSVSLWLPSQNGCFALLPQAHQK